MKEAKAKQATCCMIPFMQNFGRGRTARMASGRAVVAKDWWCRGGTGDEETAVVTFPGVGHVLCGAVRVDT